MEGLRTYAKERCHGTFATFHGERGSQHRVPIHKSFREVTGADCREHLILAGHQPANAIDIFLWDETVAKEKFLHFRVKQSTVTTEPCDGLFLCCDVEANDEILKYHMSKSNAEFDKGNLHERKGEEQGSENAFQVPAHLLKQISNTHVELWPTGETEKELSIVLARKMNSPGNPDNANVAVLTDLYHGDDQGNAPNSNSAKPRYQMLQDEQDVFVPDENLLLDYPIVANKTIKATPQNPVELLFYYGSVYGTEFPKVPKTKTSIDLTPTPPPPGGGLPPTRKREYGGLVLSSSDEEDGPDQKNPRPALFTDFAHLSLT
jgi:hypothetical protein